MTNEKRPAVDVVRRTVTAQLHLKSQNVCRLAQHKNLRRPAARSCFEQDMFEIMTCIPKKRRAPQRVQFVRFGLLGNKKVIDFIIFETS